MKSTILAEIMTTHKCDICGDVVKYDRVENGIQLCNTDWRRRVICG